MYVKSVSLEGIKRFKKLSFDFQRPDGGFAGWTVFLGGNASGKSTILRSIALALAGPDASRQLLGNPADWIGWIHKDEKRAEVSTTIQWDKNVDHFSGQGAPPGLTFEAGIRLFLEGKEGSVNEKWQETAIPKIQEAGKRSPRGTRILSALRGPWETNAVGWFSAAYGPMRRLTGNSTESLRFSLERGCVGRFVTLFREDAALSESETWLKTNHSRWLQYEKPEIATLIEGVKSLLNDGLLPKGLKISDVTVDHVFVKDSQGVELPMRDISDGYRSVYATVLDLVHGMFSVFGIDDLFQNVDGHVIVNKPGVVLIDEIEAHLHPSWQKEIPEWLKQHFPRVQFLVTTHSPLVAQAADPNGVFLLPSPNDLDSQPRMLDALEIEKLRLGRAEKTLLGLAFGLHESRSLWAQNQIRKWQQLNAKKKANVGMSPEELEEFKQLKAQMDIAFDLGTEEL